MISRAWLFAAAVCAVGAGGLLLYARGHDAATTARDLKDARDHIETRERIDDAMANPHGCAWLDRLRGTCPAE